MEEPNLPITAETKNIHLAIDENLLAETTRNMHIAATSAKTKDDRNVALYVNNQ